MVTSMRYLRPEGQVAERQPRRRPVAEQFYQLALRADWAEPLIDVVRRISEQMHIDSKDAMRVFCNLVWSGELKCDLHRAISSETRRAIQVPAKS